MSVVTEPEIVVTEADRRAARDAEYDVKYIGIERFRQWVATGSKEAEDHVVSSPVAHAAKIRCLTRHAQSIARARTMGAFEERCAATRRALEEMPDRQATRRALEEMPTDRQSAAVSSLLDVFACTVAAVADITFDDAEMFLRGARTDDDIRALVAAGWEVTM